MLSGYADYSLYGSVQQPASPTAELTKDAPLRWKAAEPADAKTEQKSVDINKSEALNYFGYGDYNLIGEMEEPQEAAPKVRQSSLHYKQQVTDPVASLDIPQEGVKNDSFELGYGTYQLYTGDA